MAQRLQLILAISSLVGLVGLLACSEERRFVGPSHDTEREVLRVPSEYASIQAALDQAGPFDTVLVADGTYSGPGNRDIDLTGRAVVIISENGPAETVIDAGGSPNEYHRHFFFGGPEVSSVTIRGFTLTGGYHGAGGSVRTRSSSPRFIECVFFDNQSDISGGAVRCKTANPRFENCTFAFNRAPAGGTVFCIAESRPYFLNCIITATDYGGAFDCDGTEDQPRIYCSNIFGNNGGDWSGGVEMMGSMNHNFSSDPLFCNPDGDLYLQEDSPCSPTRSPCGELIGALAAGGCSGR